MESNLDLTLVEGDLDAQKDAAFRLMRLVEYSGYSLADFKRLSVPSGGHPTSGVVLAMGYQASEFFGHHNLLNARGYIWPGVDGSRVIPTVHPSFIQRGQSRWSAAFIADLQKAVGVALEGVPPQVTDYVLDPSPMVAYQWATDYLLALRMDPRLRLAFDIETPGKGDDEEELEVGDDGRDRTWRIDRIGFSCHPLSALSVPWSPEYMACIRALLGSRGEKIVWNAGFDVPRVRRAGVGINGLIHDAMVAWHILHSDLPKSLKFVATFTCPYQPAWKHLSGAKPAFYNATDADVELRSMWAIDQELRRSGLWDVYQRDVLDLEPVLVHMQDKGMPIDSSIRLDRAIKLAEKQASVLHELEALTPMEARRIAHVYQRAPGDISGLLRRPSSRLVPICSKCGLERPGKPHAKVFKKKLNPCAGAGIVQVEKQVDEFYRLADFTPSRDQLIRIHQVLRRPLPMTWDKKTRSRKVSFGERQVKDLALKYPADPLYNLVLTYREIDKLSGVYVGRPVED